MNKIEYESSPNPILMAKFLITIVYIFLLATGCVNSAKHQSAHLQQTQLRAQNGELEAQLELAKYYLNRNESTDQASALSWFQTAADNGSAEGAYQAYKLLLTIKPEQYSEATELLEQAAAMDHPQAQLILADSLMEASPADNEAATKAFDLYQRAATQGLTAAQSKLATMLFAGYGTDRNLKASSQWFERAATQGNSRAQLLLGDFYLLGLGVSKDLDSAIDWYEKSALQGDPDAQSKLGDLYSYDQFNAIYDPETALDWYQQAASNDVIHAQARLGKMYEDGTGVRRNIESATRWYRQAADRGSPMAQCQLGSFYHRGIGVTQDRDQAEYWFNLAAAQIPAGVKPIIGFIYYDCTQFDNQTVALSPELNNLVPE